MTAARARQFEGNVGRERLARVLRTVECLRRVAETGQTTREDGGHIAEIFGSFLARAHEGLTLDEAFGLGAARGEESWLEIYMRELRIRALRRADEILSPPECNEPLRSRVEALGDALRRYERAWARDRVERSCPARYRGRVEEHLFAAFTAHHNHRRYVELRGRPLASPDFPRSPSHLREMLSDCLGE